MWRPRNYIVAIWYQVCLYSDHSNVSVSFLYRVDMMVFILNLFHDGTELILLLGHPTKDANAHSLCVYRYGDKLIAFVSPCVNVRNICISPYKESSDIKGKRTSKA